MWFKQSILSRCDVSLFSERLTKIKDDEQLTQIARICKNRTERLEIDPLSS